MYSSPSLQLNQRAALDDMAAPRSSPLRARRHRMSVIRVYRRDALALGYTLEQVAFHVGQLWDMYDLERIASE